MAVRDCVELLGYTVDKLGWALDAMAKTDNGMEEPNASGARGAAAAAVRRTEDDLHAWHSAALGNQDTCLEDFHGTDGRLLRHVEAAVAQLSQLVSNLLAMHKRLRSITPLLYHAPPGNNGTGGGAGDPGSELPPWVMDIEDGGGGDEELLLKRAAPASGRCSWTS